MSKRKGKKEKRIYFSDEEWDYIESITKATNFQDTTKYIRYIAINGKVVHKDLEALCDYTNEVHKIGVNINQIAKKINATNSIYKEDIENIQEEFLKLQEIVVEKLYKDDWEEIDIEY